MHACIHQPVTSYGTRKPPTPMTRSPLPPQRAQATAKPGTKRAPGKATPKAGLHPRNRHQGRYDFDALIAESPELTKHLITTPYGERSIDFARAESVRALNAALLALHYGVKQWQLPAGYLCPPVPGRADYVHGLADLLASDNGGSPPTGRTVRALDIGIGANGIYPLIGHAEYDWRFVGSDVDAEALRVAQSILDQNPGFSAAIELRVQADKRQLFTGIVKQDECFALSLCNPPFHASAQEAAQGSAQKWQKLGKTQRPADRKRPVLNFGGQSNELWCAGGEAGFLRRMIRESVTVRNQIGWFSSLVAKAEHLAALRSQLQAVQAREVRVVPMAQGNKQSRFIAWTFLDTELRRRRWIGT